MSDDPKKHSVSDGSSEWFVSKLPPWVSEERREYWRRLIYDTVLSALLVYEELLTDEPKPARFLCPRCLQWLRSKANPVGERIRCPKCSVDFPLVFNRN